MLKQLWEEKFIGHFPYKYQITSLIMFFIILSIYIVFSIISPSFFNIFFPFDRYHFIQVFSLSMLISMEIAGVPYLINSTLRSINILEKLCDFDLYKIFERLTSGRVLRLVVYLAIVMPFLMIDLYEGNLFGFYATQGRIIDLILDIYNDFIIYISLFLLADIVWILINISALFWIIRRYPYEISSRYNVFNLYLKLKPINYFILEVLTFFFMIVTLAILSYITPFISISTQFPYQWIILVIILLIMSLLFFINGLISVRRILDICVESEIDEIDNKRQDLLKDLLNMATDGDFNKRKDEIDNINSMIEVLHTQEERIMENYDKSFSISRYIMAMGTFITTGLIPLITLWSELMHLSK